MVTLEIILYSLAAVIGGWRWTCVCSIGGRPMKRSGVARQLASVDVGSIVAEATQSQLVSQNWLARRCRLMRSACRAFLTDVRGRLSGSSSLLTISPSASVAEACSDCGTVCWLLKLDSI